MDYDFITTCNWTATGTYTLRAHRGSMTNVVTSYSLFYRKKGDITWIETTDGTVSITSTGEWEIANNWNKSGNDCLAHSYYGITAINKCTKVEFDETALGTTVGDYFMNGCWRNCTSLTSMPTGFNLPIGITTIGNYFLYGCWYGCTSLNSMPSGFNLPTGISGAIGMFFVEGTWSYCTSLTSMPVGFNIPTGITSAGDYFMGYCWSGCTSLNSMPSGFNLPSGLTTVDTHFFEGVWHGCTKLASMPSGFNIPSGLTTVGGAFLESCWYNCTALDNDGYTENITFEFTTSDAFGGTCPITPDSPAGTKATPVNVAVNREVLEPTVTTQACTNITYNSVSGNGNITDIGSASPTTRGFCYIKASTGDPTTSDSKVSTTGTYSTGAFSISITSLDADSDYRVRAYATNSVGTSYGDTVSVSTTSAEPTVTTQACTDVSYYSVTGNGNITSIGGFNPTIRGFCYLQGTSGTPTTADSIVSTTGTYSTGAFSISITSLTALTSYRVRAYATNSAGTSYGDTVDVTTEQSVMPTVPPTISFTNRDKITSTWGQLRQFFYKSWLFGSRNVKFGSIGYTFGGTNIKEEQKFSDRDKITTNWQ